MALFSRQSFEKRVQALFEVNRNQSKKFVSKAAQTARRKYREKHPTGVILTQCMDGRVDFPDAMGLPLGIARQFRSLGGLFRLGWPYFGHVVNDAVSYSFNSGNDCLFIATYHFSQGDSRRGCAGCDFDVPFSIYQAELLRQQVESAYAKWHPRVHSVVCGQETDSGALIWHGANKKTLNLADATGWGIDDLASAFRKLYPMMPEKMLGDLVELAVGNIKNIVAIRDSGRLATTVIHQEFVLAVGRGLDWLPYGTALSIGPWNERELRTSIEKACVIIKKNMQEERVPDDGFLLLASSQCTTRQDSAGEKHAIARAAEIARFAQTIIGCFDSKLAGKMHTKTGVTDLDTRLFCELTKDDLRLFK